MPYAYRERKCAKCPTIVKGHLPPTKDILCIECAVKNAMQAAVQLANKSGPYYDRWLASRGPQGRPPNPE